MGGRRGFRPIDARRYQRALIDQDLAATTVARYVAELRRLERWADRHRLDVGRLDRYELERYLSGRGLGPDARRGVIGALARFYRWAIREGMAAADPTVELARPRRRPGLPRPISDADLAMALELAQGELRTMVLLGALAGLRVAEMHGLRWADVDLTGATVNVLGKGRRRRIVPLPAPLVMHLRGLDDRRGRVLTTTSATNASQRLNGYLHSIGVAATAHQLRHWYGTQAYRQDRDIYAVMHAMGHASPSTTAVYAEMDGDRLRHMVNGIRLPGGWDGQQALELGWEQ